MTPPTGSAALLVERRAGNAPHLGGALSMNDFAEQLNTQSEMLDGLKDTMYQTISEMRELIDNAPHEVLAEMARRMRDQLQQGGMLEIEDRLMQLLERKDTLLKGVFGGNVWDDIRKEMEEIERRETRENQIGNARQDANESEQQRAEEIRRQQEWESKTHNVAGVEMTGIEIDELIETLSNPIARQELIARRAKDKNISEEEALKQINRELEYLRAIKRIEIGQGTPADRIFVSKFQNDREAMNGINSTITAQSSDRRSSNSNESQVTVSLSEAPVNEIEQKTTNDRGTRAISECSINHRSISAEYNSVATGADYKTAATPSPTQPTPAQIVINNQPSNGLDF